MLMASGVNFGWLKTIPHMLGVSGGFAILLFAVGLGLGQIFENAPILFTALKFAGGAYLLYLAWQIANSGPMEVAQGEAQPMSFFAAAAFQWVNPKAWVMAVTAMATYTDKSSFFTSVIVVALVFTIVNLPCVSIWAGFGTGLRQFLSDPRLVRWFNWAMAILLVLSLWPMLR